MREYIKGWKRKAGCVTLIMACVLAAAWVRASTVRDWISVPVDTAEYFFQIDDRGISVSKNKDLMHLGHFDDCKTEWRISEPIIKRSSKVDSQEDENDLDETVRHWWGLKNIHLIYLINGYEEKVLSWRSARWTIPHWLMVVPLTLLSAYLLLSKPRQRKPPVPHA